MTRDLGKEPSSGGHLVRQTVFRHPLPRLDGKRTEPQIRLPEATPVAPRPLEGGGDARLAAYLPSLGQLPANGLLPLAPVEGGGEPPQQQAEKSGLGASEGG